MGNPSGSGTQAARDIVDWKATLRAQPVGGDGSIAGHLIAPLAGLGHPPRRAIVTITVQWGERQGNTPYSVTSSQI